MNKEKRKQANRPSLRVNAVLNTLKTVLGIVFPLITYPYISRVLQVDAIGVYNFSASIVSYFVMIAGLGVANYAVREGTKYKNNTAEMYRFTSELFSINAISTIISYVFLLFTIFVVPKLHSYTVPILLISIQMLFNTLGVSWLCNIFEDFLAITIRTLLSQIISLISLFVFVKTPDDLNIYIIIVTFSLSAANFLNFFYVRSKYTKFCFTLKCNIKEHLKPILILFSTSLTILVYVSADSTMLGFFSNDYQVGLYSTAVKIYSILKQVLVAILVVSIPRFSLLINSDKKDEAENLLTKVFNTLTFLALPASVGLCVVSRETISLIAGQSYLDGSSSLSLLSVAIIFSLYAGIFFHCVLIPFKCERIALKASIISAVTNIGLNFIFIPLMGINGAAITTIIAEITVFVVAYVYSRNLIELKGVKVNFIQSFVGCILILIVCLLMRTIISNDITRLFVSVILSALSYALILILLRNEIALGTISALKSRFSRIKHFNNR